MLSPFPRGGETHKQCPGTGIGEAVRLSDPYPANTQLSHRWAQCFDSRLTSVPVRQHGPRCGLAIEPLSVGTLDTPWHLIEPGAASWRAASPYVAEQSQWSRHLPGQPRGHRYWGRWQRSTPQPPQTFPHIRQGLGHAASSGHLLGQQWGGDRVLQLRRWKRRHPRSNAEPSTLQDEGTLLRLP